MMTDYKAPRQRVILFDINIFDPNNIENSIIEVIPQHKQNILNGIKVIDNKLVTFYMENASDKMKVFELNVDKLPARYIQDIQLPDMGSVGTTSGQQNDSSFFFEFNSFSDPGSTYRCDMRNNFKIEKLYDSQFGQMKNFNSSDYKTD